MTEELRSLGRFIMVVCLFIAGLSWAFEGSARCILAAMMLYFILEEIQLERALNDKENEIYRYRMIIKRECYCKSAVVGRGSASEYREEQECGRCYYCQTKKEIA